MTKKEVCPICGKDAFVQSLDQLLLRWCRVCEQYVKPVEAKQ